MRLRAGFVLLVVGLLFAISCGPTFADATSKKTSIGSDVARTSADENALRESAHAASDAAWNNEAIVAYSTVFLAVVTLGLAIFTAKLWASTKLLAVEARATSERQALEMEKSLALAERSTEAALISASAAQIQASATADQVRRSHRAWVGVVTSGSIEAGLSFEEGKIRLDARLALRNGGGSVATGVVNIARLSVTPIPHGDPRMLAFDESESFNPSGQFGALILPGETHGVDFSVEVFVPQIAALSAVFLACKICYLDEFDVHHATTYLLKFVLGDGSEIFGLGGTGKHYGYLKALGIGSKAF